MAEQRSLIRYAGPGGAPTECELDIRPDDIARQNKGVAPNGLLYMRDRDGVTWTLQAARVHSIEAV